MATRIIIETDEPDIEASEHIIRYILMDALAEFQSNRGPTSRDYVDERYPDVPDYAWLDRKKKVQQVDQRKMLADRLHHALAFFKIVWNNDLKDLY